MNVKKEMIENPSGEDYLLTTTTFQTTKGTPIVVKTERFNGVLGSLKGSVGTVEICIDSLHGPPDIEYPYYIHIEGEKSGKKHLLYKSYLDAKRALANYFSETQKTGIVKSLREFEKTQDFETITIK